MDTCSIIELAADTFIGTPLEIVFYAALLCLLILSVMFALKLVLGENGIKALLAFGARINLHIQERATYAPEWEKWRARIEPFVSLSVYLLCALASVFGAFLFMGILLVYAPKANYAALLVGAILFLVCCVYLRFSLAAASRAHARIKTRGGDG